MKTKHWAILIGTFTIIMFGIIIFRPVPTPDEKDCLIAKGTVIEISEAGEKDIVFRLTGNDKTFYINRGLERGLDMKALRSELLEKEITIKYPQYWTPLGNSSKHISKLESSGRTVFSEID